MYAPTVNYTLQNYGAANEKLAFEWNKSFIDATTNLHQQNPCMTSGSFRNHSLLYHLLCTVSGISYCMCLSVKYYHISYTISYSILFIDKIFLIVLDIF